MIVRFGVRVTVTIRIRVRERVTVRSLLRVTVIVRRGVRVGILEYIYYYISNSYYIIFIHIIIKIIHNNISSCSYENFMMFLFSF